LTKLKNGFKRKKIKETGRRAVETGRKDYWLGEAERFEKRARERAEMLERLKGKEKDKDEDDWKEKIPEK